MADEKVKNPFVGKLLLNPAEVARALSRSKRSIYNQISEGVFPIRVRRRGRRLLFRVQDVINYCDSL